MDISYYIQIISVRHKIDYFSEKIAFFHSFQFSRFLSWIKWWINVLQRLTICLSSPCLCFLICKLIKIKSEHKMVFKKFKWNNLHWECVKMLMHSFTKPHNHCHPLWALIVFHMDGFIHYCKIINIKNISVLIFLLFVKAQSTIMSSFFLCEPHFILSHYSRNGCPKRDLFHLSGLLN